MKKRRSPKGRKLKPGMRVRKTMCKTCVFRDPKEGGIDLAPGRHDEIRANLLNGTNQLCHYDDKTVCRGGRDFQLQCFHRLGLIEKPTDEALRQAMINQGVQPGSHV